MATALASALAKIPVRRDVAMTGEITLRGKVLAIGGLKEKLLAALRAGIFETILPRANEKDLSELPDNIKNVDEAPLRRHHGRSAGAGARTAAAYPAADRNRRRSPAFRPAK